MTEVRPEVDLFYDLEVDRKYLPKLDGDDLEFALTSYKAFAIREIARQLPQMRLINPAVISTMADLVWMSYNVAFQRTALPIVLGVYAAEFAKAGIEDVGEDVLERLALKHVATIGDYFHETSKAALIQGYNTNVNKKMPPKAALEKVTPAFGLTPKQMSGYTSMKAIQPVDSAVVGLTDKKLAKEYAEKSFFDRIRVLVRQETHNLKMTAQQRAWSYLVDKGSIGEDAEKTWITAKDERVCVICGPFHGAKAKVNEPFEVKGMKLYTPGAHVNCRCEVRLVDIELLSNIGKAQQPWYATKQKRTSDGRFTEVPGAPKPPSGHTEEVQRGAESFLRRTQKELPAELTPQQKKKLEEVRQRIRAARRAPEELEEPVLQLSPTLGATSTLGNVTLGESLAPQETQAAQEIQPTLELSQEAVAELPEQDDFVLQLSQGVDRDLVLGSEKSTELITLESGEPAILSFTGEVLTANDLQIAQTPEKELKTRQVYSDSTMPTPKLYAVARDMFGDHVSFVDEHFQESELVMLYKAAEKKQRRIRGKKEELVADVEAFDISDVYGPMPIEIEGMLHVDATGDDLAPGKRTYYGEGWADIAAESDYVPARSTSKDTGGVDLKAHVKVENVYQVIDMYAALEAKYDNEAEIPDDEIGRMEMQELTKPQFSVRYEEEDGNEFITDVSAMEIAEIYNINFEDFAVRVFETERIHTDSRGFAQDSRDSWGVKGNYSVGDHSSMHLGQGLPPVRVVRLEPVTDERLPIGEEAVDEWPRDAD